MAKATKGADKDIWPEMQGNKGETKVLAPLLESLAGTAFCAGTLCWNLARTPFLGWNPSWNPPLCAHGLFRKFKRVALHNLGLLWT